MWPFPPASSEITDWVIAVDFHCDIYNLYPITFNQSHSSMHIKEGCITACM